VRCKQATASSFSFSAFGLHSSSQAAEMADHPGQPPGGSAGGPTAGPGGENPSTGGTAVAIMPPSPAAIRLFGDVRKGLEKSATGTLTPKPLGLH